MSLLCACSYNLFFILFCAPALDFSTCYSLFFFSFPFIIYHLLVDYCTVFFFSPFFFSPLNRCNGASPPWCFATLMRASTSAPIPAPRALIGWIFTEASDFRCVCFFGFLVSPFLSSHSHFFFWPFSCFYFFVFQPHSLAPISWLRNCMIGDSLQLPRLRTQHRHAYSLPQLRRFGGSHSSIEAASWW